MRMDVQTDRCNSLHSICVHCTEHIWREENCIKMMDVFFSLSEAFYLDNELPEVLRLDFHDVWGHNMDLTDPSLPSKVPSGYFYLLLWQRHKRRCFIEFLVLRAVVTNNSIFWNITPCSSLKVNRSFIGTCRFHLHGRRISQAGIQYEASRKHCWYLAWIILRSWRWRRHVSPKCQLTFNGLQGVLS
jgi:hypothetical protein